MHQLPARFQKSRIADIQPIKGSSDEAIANSIVNQLKAVKEKYGVRPTLYELERDLIQEFDGISANIQTDVLLDAAESIGIERTGVDGVREKSRWLARKLFKINLEQLEAVIGVLPEGIREKSGSVIVNKVAPFCWIDEQAAARVLEVANEPPPKRGAGLNSDNVLTARMYLRRACRRSKLWPFQELPATWSTRARKDIVDSVRILVQAMVGYLPDDNVNARDLEAALQEEVQRNGPVFVIVPPIVYKVDPNLIFWLMDVEEFKLVTFVILLGNITPKEFQNDRSIRIEYVHPPLDRQKECEALRKIRKLSAN